MVSMFQCVGENDEPEEVLGQAQLRHTASAGLVQCNRCCLNTGCAQLGGWLFASDCHWSAVVGIVTMQAPMEMLSDHHCKDKFLVQSVVMQDRATMKDFGPQLVHSCSLQRVHCCQFL